MIRRDFDIQGHRGARGLRPENTLPAFRRALEIGVTTLEMDVAISADDEVVVSHDPWMSSDICTKPDGNPVEESDEHSLRLYGMRYEEIGRYDCGSRRNAAFPDQQPEAAPKPLLRDVISMAEQACRDLGRAPVRYNIETKSRPGWDGVYHPDPETFTSLLREVVAESGVLDRSTIQSFDVRTLRAARRMEPAWAVSLLVGRYAAPFIHLNLRRLGFIPYVYSPHFRAVSARRVRRAHAAGMVVIPWTVNSKADMVEMMHLQVDGLITDYPDRGVHVLERFLTSQDT